MKQGDLFAPHCDRAAPLRVKNEVAHFELPCRSILNHCDTRRMPDTFTINPYRGCEFGCRYCYARYTHEFMELDGQEFEKKIFVKRGAARVLLRSLDQRKIGNRHIAIGTATDPYQPAEAKFELTRQLLEVFAQVGGLSLSITTKSSLVRRDIELFQRIARNNDFQVNMSLISLDPKLLARLEPKASRPQARLDAVREIASRGVRAGIFMMPVLPGLTDSEENLRSVIEAARRHGAHYVHADVLFLRKSSKAIFYRFLAPQEPELYQRYRRIYGRRSASPDAYRRRVLTRIARLKREFGYDDPRTPPRRERPGRQKSWLSRHPE